MLSDCRDKLHKPHYAAGQQIPELLRKDIKMLDPFLRLGVYRWAIYGQQKVNVKIKSAGQEWGQQKQHDVRSVLFGSVNR